MLCIYVDVDDTGAGHKQCTNSRTATRRLTGWRYAGRNRALSRAREKDREREQ